MKPGILIPFSEEIIQAIEKYHQDFFAPVSSAAVCTQKLEKDQCPAGAKLEVRWGDRETISETRLNADGDTEKTYQFVVDNDDNPTNGRIYKIDKFILSKKDSSIKYLYGYTYNGRGIEKKQWRSWLGQIHQRANELNKKAYDKFVKELVPSFSRPFTEKEFQLIKKLSRFLPIPIPFDPRSQITVLRNDLSTEIHFSFWIKDKSENRTFVLNDQFFIAANSQSLIGHHRKYLVPPGIPADQKLNDFVEQLNRSAKPTIADADNFIKKFLPDILSQPPMQGASMIDGAQQKSQMLLDDLEEGFLEDFQKGEEYFKDVKSALGEKIHFDLRDPLVDFSVRVRGEFTEIDFRHSFQEKGVAYPDETLKFTETWVFKDQRLVSIYYQLRPINLKPGGPLDQAYQRLGEMIQNKKSAAHLDEKTKDFAKIILPYFTPHLSYGEQPTLLKQTLEKEANEELSEDKEYLAKIFYLRTIETIHQAALPLLYEGEFHHQDRLLLLRVLEEIRFGDLETFQQAAKNLSARIEKAGARFMSIDEIQRDKNTSFGASKGEAPDKKDLYFQDLFYSLTTLINIFNHDFEMAYKNIRGIHSPELNGLFKTPIEKMLKKQLIHQQLKLLEVIANEQITLHAQAENQTSYRLKNKTPYDPKAEKEALASLLEKARLQNWKGLALDLPSLLAELLEGFTPDDNDGAVVAIDPPLKEDVEITKRILQNPVFQELTHSRNTILKAQQVRFFLNFAETVLYKYNLFQSIKYIGEWLVHEKVPKNATLESLEIFKKITNAQLEQKTKSVIEGRLEAFLQDLAAEEQESDEQETELENPIPKNLSKQMAQELLQWAEETAQLLPHIQQLKKQNEALLSSDPKIELEIQKLVQQAKSQLIAEKIQSQAEKLEIVPHREALESLQTKLTQLAVTNTDHDRGILGLLRELDSKELSPQERSLREGLLKDKILIEFSSVGDQAVSPLERKNKYAGLLESRLLTEAGLEKLEQELIHLYQSGRLVDMSVYEYEQGEADRKEFWETSNNLQNAEKNLKLEEAKQAPDLNTLHNLRSEVKNLRLQTKRIQEGASISYQEVQKRIKKLFEQIDHKTDIYDQLRFEGRKHPFVPKFLTR